MKTTLSTLSIDGLPGRRLRVFRAAGPSTRLLAPARAGAALLLACLLSIGLPMNGQGQRVGVGGKRDLTVMTRNLYVGADFDAITDLDPTDPDYLMNLVTAVSTVFYTIVEQNSFHVRVAGIANEIAATQPDLVGLQEASSVRLQSPGDLLAGGTTPASAVVVDFRQVLLEALAARGVHYAVVSIVTNLDVELPVFNPTTGGIDDARLTDHDVILARTDLPPGYLRLRHAAQGNFEANLVIPALGLELKRGWCSVDAFVRGRTFRFINTHLEEETSPEIQWLQAEELLAGPANVALPVILVGDCNTDGNGQNGTVTYDGLLNAGFNDSWSAVHPGDLGLTWGHDTYLANPGLPFVWRIDLILYRAGIFTPLEAAVLDTPLSRELPPFWASDHAGVVARFLLK